MATTASPSSARCASSAAMADSICSAVSSMLPVDALVEARGIAGRDACASRYPRDRGGGDRPSAEIAATTEGPDSTFTRSRHVRDPASNQRSSHAQEVSAPARRVGGSRARPRPSPSTWTDFTFGSPAGVEDDGHRRQPVLRRRSRRVHRRHRSTGLAASMASLRSLRPRRAPDVVRRMVRRADADLQLRRRVRVPAGLGRSPISAPRRRPT